MQNISFETLYGGQFMLSIELIKLNYPNLTALCIFIIQKESLYSSWPMVPELILVSTACRAGEILASKCVVFS